MEKPSSDEHGEQLISCIILLLSRPNKHQCKIWLQQRLGVKEMLISVEIISNKRMKYLRKRQNETNKKGTNTKVCFDRNIYSLFFYICYWCY